MAATYTPSLRLAKPGIGDVNWGTTANDGTFQLTDFAIAGTANITIGGSDYTLTNLNGVTDEARAMFVAATGTPAAPRNVICPAVSKLYFFRNGTTGPGQTLTFKTLAGSGIAVPAGSNAILYCNGTDVVNAVDRLSSLTLGTALPVASGGTGATTSTGSGAVVLATNPTISRVTVTGNAQTTPVVVTFSATAMTVNCTLSNVFTTTFTANVTVAPTISNPQDGQTINWFITQDGTGGRTMTWPSSFKWPTGSSSTLSTAGNAVDLVTATYRSATGLWYATLLKQFV